MALSQRVGIRPAYRGSILGIAAFHAERRTRSPALHRFFTTFPDSLPGWGLLLLRTGLGAAMAVQGVSLLASVDASNLAMWILGVSAIASGALLLVGLMTPGAGLVAGACSIIVLCCVLDSPGSSPFNVARTALVTTNAAAVFLLGPGAFSVDARLFGRREIIIPHERSPLDSARPGR
jgi:uncharacterized membrane protein YphA (DoxX/SURF4 family)